MSPMNGRSTPYPRRIAVAHPTEVVWLSEAEVCERVPGMTVETLKSLREERNGPPYYKPSLRTVVYSQDAVDKWAKEMKRRLRQGGGAR